MEVSWWGGPFLVCLILKENQGKPIVYSGLQFQQTPPRFLVQWVANVGRDQASKHLLVLKLSLIGLPNGTRNLGSRHFLVCQNCSWPEMAKQSQRFAEDESGESNVHLLVFFRP